MPSGAGLEANLSEPLKTASLRALPICTTDMGLDGVELVLSYVSSDQSHGR